MLMQKVYYYYYHYYYILLQYCMDLIKRCLVKQHIGISNMFIQNLTWTNQLFLWVDERNCVV